MLAQLSLFALLRYHSVALGEDGDQAERVFAGSCRLAGVRLEEVLQLGRDMGALADPSTANAAGLSDDLSDFVSADRVNKSSLLPDPFLVCQVGLEVVLIVSLQLTVQLLVLDLNTLALYDLLALEVFATAVPTEVLLNDHGCTSSLLVLLLLKTLEMCLSVDNAGDQVLRHGLFQVLLVDCLVNHEAVLSLSWALLYRDLV